MTGNRFSHREQRKNFKVRSQKKHVRIYKWACAGKSIIIILSSKMLYTTPSANTENTVQIVINSAIIVSILLATCVCREKPRFHVYLLLLANLFGVIYSILIFYQDKLLATDIEQFSAQAYNIATAAIIFMNLASNFTFLVGFFALQQLTKTYLGGTQLWIKVASTLASLWTLVILILSGVATTGLSFTKMLVMFSIFDWGLVAVCVLLLLVLLGIRIAYHKKVPSGKARRQVVLTFALIALYTCLLTVNVVYTIVIDNVPDLSDDSVAVANLVMFMIFFKAPGFLFAIFYRRLSAMVPYVEQSDVESTDVTPLKT